MLLKLIYWNLHLENTILMYRNRSTRREGGRMFTVDFHEKQFSGSVEKFLTHTSCTCAVWKSRIVHLVYVDCGSYAWYI